MSLSDIAKGLRPSLSTKCVQMAKPTPASLRHPVGRPDQNKLYPAPDSSSLPVSENLVSLRAAMSIRYRSSSFATRAVPRGQ